MTCASLTVETIIIRWESVKPFWVMGWVSLRLIYWVYRCPIIFLGKHDLFIGSEIGILGSSSQMDPDDFPCSGSWGEREIMDLPFF